MALGGANLVQRPESRSAERRMIEKRVTKTGDVRWRAHVRLVMNPLAPPESRSKTFSKLRDAEEWHAETERNMRRQRAGLSAVSTRAKLSELVEQYRDAKHPRPYATSPDRKVHLDWWVDVLNDAVAARVRGAQIRTALDTLDCSPKTKNRYLSSLSAVYRWAIRQDLVETNPCAGVERQSESGHVVRFLSDAERVALWNAVKLEEAPLRAMYLVSLWTGGRFSEVLGLRWRHIDTARALIHYPATKGGKPRAVPAPAEVFTALGLLGEHDPDVKVFPVFSRRGWRRALKRSKVASFHWHCLRHSCASWLVQHAVPIADVQHILGHKSIQTSLRYAHLEAGPVQARVSALYVTSHPDTSGPHPTLGSSSAPPQSGGRQPRE